MEQRRLENHKAFKGAYISTSLIMPSTKEKPLILYTWIIYSSTGVMSMQEDNMGREQTFYHVNHELDLFKSLILEPLTTSQRRV